MSTQRAPESLDALTGWVSVYPHALPVLPSSPDAAEVTAYLRWLADSPFCYHLDDDPEDCGFLPAIGRVLAWNVSVLRDVAVCGALSWAEMWGIYHPDSNPDGRA